VVTPYNIKPPEVWFVTLNIPMVRIKLKNPT